MGSDSAIFVMVDCYEHVAIRSARSLCKVQRTSTSICDLLTPVSTPTERTMN